MMLKVSDLVTGYGRVTVLRGISLQVEKGEIVSIIGANGAGKTTLLNTISGLMKAWAGKVGLEGEILRPPPNRVTGLGVIQVPEGRKVFPNLSVRENLVMGAYRIPWKRSTVRMDEVFDLFPVLRERQKQPAGTLSGGEQQMLAIGRGLMGEPKLMLLDEPSLGLAPLVVQNIFGFLKQMNRQGLTMLLVEQNARQALSISHRSYVLENGRIVLEGTSAELQSNEAVVKAYLGGGRQGRRAAKES